MTDAHPNTLLLVADRPLYGSSACREILDMALTAAAFNQPVALLIRGQACSWLAFDAPDTTGIEQSDLKDQLRQLPALGIKEIYVSSEDLKPLASRPALEGVTELSTPAVHKLYRQFSQVIHL